MGEEEILKNVRTILKSAELVYSTSDYTSATVLYFKVLFGILDCILLKRCGKAPKDHTERFRMLKEYEPELYEFLDNYFRIYQNTYSMSIDKQTCDSVRKNVKRIMERYQIQEGN